MGTKIQQTTGQAPPLALFSGKSVQHHEMFGFYRSADGTTGAYTQCCTCMSHA